MGERKISNNNNSELNIGIVFSGGFAKGAYEIGFCKALLEYTDKVNIKAVSGSSIGGLNAYGFINNKLDYLYDIWKNIDFRSSKEFFLSQQKRNIVYKYIDELVEKSSSSDLPCFINYIKVPNIKLCYENINNEEKEIQNALLKACISVPTLYKPVHINNSVYVDGAFLDNTPIIPLKNKDLDLIFVLRFDHASENYKNLDTNATIIEIAFEDDKTLRNYFYFNKNLTNKLIKEGYNQSKVILNNIFKQGNDIEYINSLKSLYNKESPKNILPRTGEQIVNKINKLNKIFKTEFVSDIEMKNDDYIILD